MHTRSLSWPTYARHWTLIIIPTTAKFARGVRSLRGGSSHICTYYFHFYCCLHVYNYLTRAMHGNSVNRREIIFACYSDGDNQLLIATRENGTRFPEQHDTSSSLFLSEHSGTGHKFRESFEPQGLFGRRLSCYNAEITI